VTFLIPVIYYLIPDRFLPLKLFNIVKLVLLAVLPRSSLSSGRPRPCNGYCISTPPSLSAPAANSSCCCRQPWTWSCENLNLNPWLLLPLESNKNSRFMRGWGVVVTIVDDIGRIDLWWKWDGGERRRGWKETKHLSSSLSVMSQTKNHVVSRAIKTFLSISRLCMCRKGRRWRRFCSWRRRWGWGGSVVSVARRGPLRRESSGKRRPITLI